MEVTVIARSKAKPGREDEWERELRKVVAPTHREAGCLRYAIHRGIEDRGTFLVVERWSSREALDLHLKSPHVLALFGAAKDLSAGPAEILTYELLREGTEKGTL